MTLTGSAADDERANRSDDGTGRSGAAFGRLTSSIA